MHFELREEPNRCSVAVKVLSWISNFGISVLVSAICKIGRALNSNSFTVYVRSATFQHQRRESIERESEESERKNGGEHTKRVDARGSSDLTKIRSYGRVFSILPMYWLPKTIRLIIPFDALHPFPIGLSHIRCTCTRTQRYSTQAQPLMHGDDWRGQQQSNW